MMKNEIILLPKTRAGKHLRNSCFEILRERLTTYGSQAVVKLGHNLIIVYWHNHINRFVVIPCGINYYLAHRLWSEVV